MPNEQTVQTSSEDLRKNTREAVAALSNAISKLSEQLESVMETKDAAIKEKFTQLVTDANARINQIAEKISATDNSIAGFKESVKTELFANNKGDIEKMRAETATAIESMQKAKEDMVSFKTEMNLQMQQEKAKIAKFFSGINSLLGQI